MTRTINWQQDSDDFVTSLLGDNGEARLKEIFATISTFDPQSLAQVLDRLAAEDLSDNEWLVAVFVVGRNFERVNG